MEKNKKIIKLCYLQIALYVVFLTSLLLHFKRGLDHRAFALLIILTLLGCASALTLTDYLKSLIRRNGADRFNPFFFRVVAPDPHLFFLLRRNLLHQKFHHLLPPLDLMIIPCQAV